MKSLSTSLFTTLLFIVSILFSCSKSSDSNVETPDNVVEALEPEPLIAEYSVVGMKFDGPTELMAGWNTFRIKNLSAMVHFAVIEKLPENIHMTEQQQLVAPVFQNFMDNFNGKPLSAPDAGMNLPEWFSSVVFLGGPGLTAPNTISETTVYLQPGNYILECYVKTDGIFHSYNPDPDQSGMVLEFKVTEDPSLIEEPQATSELFISSQEGFKLNGIPSTGDNIFKVTFNDQAVYENFVGHDVHLVKLNDDVNLDSLSVWMDWTKPHGLETPAPAEFIGGVNEMPQGQSAYMKATLEPGAYAFIAEIPNPAAHNMLLTFTISAEM